MSSASFAISSLLSRLRESLIQETIGFLGATEQVDELVSNLQKIQSSYMEYAEERLDKDEQFRKWTSEISDICYEVEDVLDDYALKVADMRRRSCGGLNDVLKRYLCNSLEMVARNKVEIATFSGRIKNLDLSRPPIKRVFVSAPAEGESSNKMTAEELIRRAPSLFQEGRINIVGLEDDIDKIRSWIVHEETENYRVIAICGSGGSGKTMIAKLIYESVEVKHHFDVRVWVFISPRYEIRSVLLDMLSEVSKVFDMVDTERIQQLDDMALVEMLYKFLEGRRYLIVLDDVYSSDIWDILRRALPQDGNNSKLLNTTRDHDLALQMTGHGAYGYVHKMIPLIPDMLVSSYKDLPDDLKSCFLYLADFPEIEAEKLYMLWMAEGIIPLGQGEESRVMEMGRSVLDDLVARSLVVAEDDEVPTIRKFKSYRLHGMLESFILEKANAGNSFEVVRGGSVYELIFFAVDTGRKIRRLAMYLDKYVDFLKHLGGMKDLRSLMFFNAYHHDQYILWPEEISRALMELRFLRVLEFDGFDFQSGTLPKGIEKLVHLRYLSLRGCYLKELQSYIGNLLNLQTLDLRVATSCKMIIPAKILCKLERLRHLYLPVAFRAKGDDKKLHFVGLKELQILKNFDPSVCHAQDLLELTNIRILDAIVRGNYKDLKAIIDVIKNTSSIREATLAVRHFDCYSRERRSTVTELFSCSGLHTLHIGGHIHQLPQINSSGLTKLSLSGSELLEDPMTTLGMVPKLWALVLRGDAYVGRVMVCSGSGFRELRHLQLCGLHKLERLAIENGSMPSLITLTIESCKSLKVPPDGLSSLASLRELTIAMMPIDFVDGLRHVEEQLHQVNPSLTIKFLDDNTKEQSAPWLV